MESSTIVFKFKNLRLGVSCNVVKSAINSEITMYQSLI